jgi:hypothetical protein
MNWMNTLSKRVSMLVAALIIAGCASMGGPQAVQVRLTGDEEVPPVKTSASGTGTVTVNEDRSVSGSIRTQGISGIAAHIHEGAAGQNGPVIVPMDKTGDNEWTTKSGAKLTESQYESFKAGRLYFNVHSAQNKGGEIRGQIRPTSVGGSRSSGY